LLGYRRPRYRILNDVPRDGKYLSSIAVEPVASETRMDERGWAAIPITKPQVHGKKCAVVGGDFSYKNLM
jgi:hypothetical protein